MEEGEEVKTVIAVGEPGQDLALTHAILDCEAGRSFSSPSDITDLVDIHEYDEAEEDKAEVLHHLLEQNTELAEIKGFRFIHG